VARFFKFKSLSDLVAGSRRLKLDLRFSEDLTPLFRPVTVGKRWVGNSLCVQPMEGCDGRADGTPDELTYRRFQRFGAGGAKLIWGEACAVTDDGRATPRQLWITERALGHFAKLVQVCRAAHRAAVGDDSDLLIGLQLTHSGRYSYPRPKIACHDPLLDPRTVADLKTGRVVGPEDSLLSDEVLGRLVKSYVLAARLARLAGFDFVDVKQCHRYLLNEVLASKTTPGQYTGSYENRTRLAREIFAAVRKAVPDLLLATRLSVFDGIPYQKGANGDGEPCPWQAPVRTAWGTNEDFPLEPDLAEPLRWVGEMRKLGVAMVNVTMGNPYASPHIIRPFETPPPDGYESPEHPLVGVERHFRLTAEVQKRYPDLPLVGSGYSYLQDFLPYAAAANLRDRRVTFVGVGRGALAQPDFARQLREQGRLDRKRVCRTFSYCTALMRSKHNAQGQYATGCPPFDKDVYGPIWQEVLSVKK
jgi:2,4-dienoyl-CoA reductase-like NADH-dependent reductase (Old Yellow Enzyme family)